MMTASAMREAIVVTSSSSTQRAIIVILIVMLFFSSFNDIDLSHKMLVDCCMLCCRECGLVAAV
jgi:hypothetical protein